LIQENHIVLEARNIGSPITLLIGEPSDQEIKMAAEITARYSSAKNTSEVEVTYTKQKKDQVIVVTPADTDEIQKFQLK